MVSLNAEHNVKRSVSKIVEEGIPLLNGGDNARMAAHEFGDQFRHHGARGVRSAADPEGAGEFPDKRTQFRRKIVKCRQQNTGAPVEKFSGRSWFEPVPAALEEPAVKLLFQQPQLFADSRLGDEKFPGRPGDAAARHDLVEIFQLYEIHSHLQICSCFCNIFPDSRKWKWFIFMAAIPCGYGST